MKISRILLIAAIGGYLLCASSLALAENASDLYQEGLMKENVEGDLNAAIEIYRKIVAEYSDTTGVAARAQLHIGICYEKLGREQAKAAYQQVIETFPAETEVVQQARERLQALEQAEQINRPEIGASPEKTSAVIEELDRRLERIQSYRAELTTSMELMGNSMTTRGTMLFSSPDLLRMESSGGPTAGLSINVFDGKLNWTYQPQINMVMKIDIDRIHSEFPEYAVNNTLSKSFQNLDAESIQYIRNTVFGEDEVAVFQGKTGGNLTQMGLGQMKPEWIEVWIGTDDGLLRKMVMYTESGEEMMVLEVTVAEINLAIPDTAFVFIPPEGAQVMDMTDGTLNMIRKARAQKTEEKTNRDTEGQDIEAVMREMHEKRKAVQSHRAHVTRQIQMMGTTMTTQTDEWHRGKKFRQETTTSMPTGTTIAISDEQTLWTYMPNMKMLQKVDMQRIREAQKEEAQEEGEEDPSDSFHGMAKETIRYLGRESLGKEEVHVFEGESAKALEGLNKFQFERLKVWIGAEDGLVRKMLGFDGDGEEVIAETRTDVETNLSLPDSLFVFIPPEGIQVMDMTDSTIDIARKMKTAMKAKKTEEK